MSYRVLLADDNAPYTLMCLERFLKDSAFNVDTALQPDECLAKIRTVPYDIVILDIDFGAGRVDGLSLIPEIKLISSRVAIVMHSNSDDRETMIRARRLGADDFVSKTNSLQELVDRARAILESRENEAEIEAEALAIAARAGAVFVSPAMHKVFVTAAKLRRAPGLDTLIRGETGTGKELIAEALSRKDLGRPYVTVNCAAIQENLAESELFGHTRGAFTGAIRDKKGKFEEADGGDIFLDEVACLPLTTQTALLRVLAKKEIERVGGKGPKSLDFRVIAATNEDLEKLVAAGKFREELFSRLKGRTIHIPPLRDRREDIEPIIRKVLTDQKRVDATLARDTLDLLKSMPWPLNVRQLRQTVEAMLANNGGGLLTLKDVPDELFDDPRATGDGACKSRLDGQRLLMEFDIASVTFDQVKEQLLNQLIHAKRQLLGKGANQTTLAEALKIPRASLQRYLKRAPTTP